MSGYAGVSRSACQPDGAEVAGGLRLRANSRGTVVWWRLTSKERLAASKQMRHAMRLETQQVVTLCDLV